MAPRLRPLAAGASLPAMTGMLDKRIAEEIAARRDDLVALTRDLIRIPTLNPPGHNYREICDYSRRGFRGPASR